MLGLKKSPRDERDYLLPAFLAYKETPPEFDRTDAMTRVRNQGQEGSCVGFAMAAGVREYHEQIDYRKFIALSPRYLYEKAKKISGHTEGTTLRAACEVAFKDGVCEEKFWPYVAKQVGAPLAGADDNAAKYKINTYARVTSVKGLKDAIYDDTVGVVIIGVTVFKGMTGDSCKKTGVVPDPTCWDRRTPLGGHALCAVGYNDKSPYFKNDGHIKVKNSWGDYGDKGYLYLSYKNIAANMMDAFATVDIDDPNQYAVLALGKRKEWVG
jgi:hypothetical protein